MWLNLILVLILIPIFLIGVWLSAIPWLASLGFNTSSDQLLVLPYGLMVSLSFLIPDLGISTVLSILFCNLNLVIRNLILILLPSSSLLLLFSVLPSLWSFKDITYILTAYLLAISYISLVILIVSMYVSIVLSVWKLTLSFLLLHSALVKLLLSPRLVLHTTSSLSGILYFWAMLNLVILSGALCLTRLTSVIPLGMLFLLRISYSYLLLMLIRCLMSSLVIMTCILLFLFRLPTLIIHINNY